MTQRVGVEFDGTNTGAVGAARGTAQAIDTVTHSAGRSSPSLKGLERDIGRVERGALAGSGALHGMGRAALYLGGAYLGAFGVGAAFKAASAALGDQVRLGAQARAVLLSTGGVAGITARAIDALATVEQRKTGIDTAQIKAAEIMLLRYTQVRDVAGQGNDVFTRATRIALDLSAALGVDASDSARQLGKALNDPARGLSILRREGAAFTKQQEDQVKKLAASGNVLGAQKALLDALAKSYGGTAEAVGRAEPWNRLRTTLTSLGASALKPLLPEFDAVTKGVAEWADGVEHNRGEQQKLRADVHDVVGVVKGAVGAVRDVTGAVGGWRSAVELLVAIKLASTLSGWSGALKVFIGSEATASGVAGASAETGVLNKRLGILRGLTSTPFKILIAYEIVRKITGSNADLSNDTSQTGDLLPIFRDGKWTDANTGAILPASGQAYWNNYFKRVNPGSAKPVAGQSAGGPAPVGGNAKQRAVVATAERLGPNSGGIYVTGGTGGAVMNGPGGSTIVGYDCSGYLYDIYRRNGITIPRTSEAQWADPHATKVPKGQEAPGDGVYFTGSSEYAPPGHCGIYIGGGKYIEYYQSEKPAKVANLADANDYWGARRWIKIKQQAGKGGADAPTGGGGGTASKNPLPASIRQAISAADVSAAAAALTPSKADDRAAVAEQRKAIDDEIAWLKSKLATNLGAEKRITLEDLLTGALGDLATLAKTKKPGGAGAASIIGLRAGIDATIGKLPATLDDVEQQAVSKLEQLRAHLRVGMTAADEARTRASIARWGGVLKAEITKQARIAADAANAAAQLWQRGWTNDVDRVLRDFQENVVNKRLDAFDRETAAHLKGLQDKFGAQTLEEQALQAFDAAQAAADEAKQRADIASQIADTQAQLDALGQPSSSGTLIDIATGQRSAIAAASGDVVQQRKDLLKQLADLNDQSAKLDLQDQRAALQSSADQSRTAANAKLTDAEQSYQDLRNAQRQSLADTLADQQTALQQNLDDWDAWITAKKRSWADFVQWLKDNGFNTGGLVDPSQIVVAPPPFSPSTSDQGLRYIRGGAVPFAAGGRVPGLYVGRNDTILSRLTPGETVIDRQLTAALEDMVANGGPSGGPMVAVFKINDREFARAMAQPLQDEQDRIISYKIQRG